MPRKVGRIQFRILAGLPHELSYTILLNQQASKLENLLLARITNLMSKPSLIKVKCGLIIKRKIILISVAILVIFIISFLGISRKF